MNTTDDSIGNSNLAANSNFYAMTQGAEIINQSAGSAGLRLNPKIPVLKKRILASKKRIEDTQNEP